MPVVLKFTLINITNTSFHLIKDNLLTGSAWNIRIINFSWSTILYASTAGSSTSKPNGLQMQDSNKIVVRILPFSINCFDRNIQWRISRSWNRTTEKNWWCRNNHSNCKEWSLTLWTISKFNYLSPGSINKCWSVKIGHSLFDSVLLFLQCPLSSGMS